MLMTVFRAKIRIPKKVSQH